MSNTAGLKKELVKMWEMRAESLNNGMGDQPYESMALKLIDQITDLEPSFDQSTVYKKYFGNANPYAGN